MAKCKICGGNVWCGVVLHTECFERLRPIWHPETDTPMTHVEYIETDEGQEPYNVSEDLICKTARGGHVLAKLHFTNNERAWIMHDGCLVDVVKWMYIPE